MDTDTVPEVNLVILGASRVGKSSFIRCSMQLPAPATAPVVTKRMLVDGTDYLVRLVEMPIDSVEIEEDDTIHWPDTGLDSSVSRVDGVLSLYDVGNKASFEDFPEMLSMLGLPPWRRTCLC